MSDLRTIRPKRQLHRMVGIDSGPLLAMVPTIAPLGCRPSASAADLAEAFVLWANEHAISTREWTVDDIWFLAQEDFAPAHDLILPPRRTFLGALQRRTGVSVVYDRRIYGCDGRVKRKTTFYRLPNGEPGTGDYRRALAA